MTNDLEDVLRRRLRDLGTGIDAAPDLEERIAHKRATQKRRFHHKLATGSAVVVAVIATSVTIAVTAGAPSQRVTTANPAATGTSNSEPAGSAPSAGDISAGKFTRTVVLDGGALTIKPAPSGLGPQIPQAQANVLVGSDAQVYDRGWNGSLGFGEISISPELTSGVEDTPAWVAVIKQATPLCPNTAPLSTPASTLSWPPGYLAVIVEGSGTKVLDYRSRSKVCSSAAKNPSVNDAIQMVSIPWQLVSLQSQTVTFRYQKPACDPYPVGASGPSLSVGGDAKTDKWDLEALIEAPYNLTYDDLIHCGGSWTTSSTQIGPIPGGPGAPPPPDPNMVSHAPTGAVGATR